jgi:hypothetical protein
MFGRMSVDKYLSRLDGEGTQPSTPLTPGTAAVFDKMRAERAAEAAAVSPEGLGSTSNTVLLRLANPEGEGARGSLLRHLSGPGGGAPASPRPPCAAAGERARLAAAAVPAGAAARLPL